MSFSSEVKEELFKQVQTARHCQIAELAAILKYTKAIRQDSTSAFYIELEQEGQPISKKGQLLLKRAFQMSPVYKEGQTQEYSAHYEDEKQVQKVIQTIKYDMDVSTVSPLVLKSVCCKRAFLRGAFLSIGSMSNPEKGYHLEFVCDELEQAKQLQELMALFDVEGKIVARKKYQVLYVKESEGIVELLNVMGAHVALMNLENLRILKDMRNSINRRVNCETANINKTVNAATKQIEDIQYIKEHYGFENLTEQLREMAQVRLEYPDASLKELGEYLEPKVGKSGVNHRLRKLGELADKLRD